MADPRGIPRGLAVAAPERDPRTRTADSHEIFGTLPVEQLREQGRRCMDCGIPFCHQGCPLGNLIPEWNDLVRRGEWRSRCDRLHATNNFPGVHRPDLPGAVRGRVRAGDQRRPGDDQVARVGDHRARVPRGLGRSRSCRRRAQAGRSASSAPGRPAWPRPRSSTPPGIASSSTSATKDRAG